MKKYSIHRASLTSHPSGIIEIVHYINGQNLPENKRTIFLPLQNLIDFEAIGYSRSEMSLFKEQPESK